MATPVRYAFTVDEWHRMGEAGLFGEDARVELMDGEVVQMSPIGSRHFDCVNRLNRLLVLAVGERAVVSVQNPVRLGNYSEPQPDLALIRPRDYSAEIAQPEDVLLLIEVADTTLAWDRDRKGPLYGRSGIPLTWIVDLKGQEVIVLQGSAPDGYLVQERVRGGGRLVLPGLLDLAVDEVLGRLR
ncbi:MAG: Uma2 family endonuclease [Acidimicrobiales bacterium]